MPSKVLWSVRRRVISALNYPFGILVLLLFKALRLLPPDAAIGCGAWLARTFGPRLRAHQVGLDNLRAAYPEKSENEIRKILLGVWDNLGRTAVEYAFLDRIFDYDPANPDTGRIRASGAKHFEEIRNSDRPCILFTAHLANWELLAVCAATFDLDLAVLFRPPSNSILAGKLDEVRGQVMGHRVASRKGALIELSRVLERGKHVGLLVDQYFWRGVEVPFFGRPAATNPALAKLARQHECLVYAARSIRLPDGGFQLELTGPIDLPRDDDGAVDVAGTMARVTQIVEGWVREHPDQWLWLHRRWRDSANPRSWLRQR